MSIEWILIIAIALVGMIVQGRLQAVFAKYSRVPTPGGMTGREAAEQMLRDNGIRDVRVVSVAGHLTDHYNPSNRTINLSQSVCEQSSISAVAVACHECGHAVQHAMGYAPLRLRSALVPLISFSSRFAIWVIIGGILLINYGGSPYLFWAGIAMVAAAALFALVTLPVEYNASARAIEWLGRSRTLQEPQLGYARQALSWAACTYLVAALSAIATLLYYLSLARRN